MTIFCIKRYFQILKFLEIHDIEFKTRAENTVREQKIRIDNMTNEQNRINFENERNQESKEELNRQNTR